MVCPAIAVPPVGTVYHLYCPALPPAALSATVPFPHRLFPVVVGAGGVVFMVAIAGVLVLSQVPLLILA